MTPLDLSLAVDALVIQLKADGISPQKIYDDLMFEVSRACEEQFEEVE